MLSLQRRRTEARFYSRRGNGAELRSKDSIFLHCKKRYNHILRQKHCPCPLSFSSEIFTFARKTVFQLSEIRNKYFRRLCYGIWLFYLHSTLKIQTFYPVFLLMNSMIRAYYELFLWDFKKESLSRFYGTAKTKSSRSGRLGVG